MEKLLHSIEEQGVEIQVGDTVLVLASVQRVINWTNPGIIGLPYPAFDISLFCSGVAIPKKLRSTARPLELMVISFDSKSLCTFVPTDRVTVRSKTQPLLHPNMPALSAMTDTTPWHARPTFFRQHTHRFQYAPRTVDVLPSIRRLAHCVIFFGISVFSLDLSLDLMFVARQIYLSRSS